jgi:hypothetical protein
VRNPCLIPATPSKKYTAITSGVPNPARSVKRNSPLVVPSSSPPASAT